MTKAKNQREIQERKEQEIGNELILEEYMNVIENLWQNRASAPDEICNELIIGHIKENLYKGINKIWEEETIPIEWRH